MLPSLLADLRVALNESLQQNLRPKQSQLKPHLKPRESDSVL